jgi:hypothetical protein
LLPLFTLEPTFVHFAKEGDENITVETNSVSMRVSFFIV